MCGIELMCCTTFGNVVNLMDLGLQCLIKHSALHMQIVSDAWDSIEEWTLDVFFDTFVRKR